MFAYSRVSESASTVADLIGAVFDDIKLIREKGVKLDKQRKLKIRLRVVYVAASAVR